MKPWPVRRGPSRLRRGLSAGTHTPRPPWFARRLVPLLRRLTPAQSPGTTSVMKPPSVQSPFAQLRCYLHWGGVLRLLGGHYPSVFAPTDSCAKPAGSPLLRHSLVQGVFVGCYQPLPPAGPSRRYLCESFPRCLGPYHDGLQGALTCYFPCNIGLPQRRT